MRLVLDKSALRALPTARIRELCAAHEIWMPEILFYELLTCDHQQRAALFRKINPVDCPLKLIGNRGYLFGRELEHRRPVNPVDDSELNGVRWIFNPRLQDPEWEPVDNMRDIADWRAHVADRVGEFRERAALTAHAFFPDLSDVRPGEMQRIYEAQQQLSDDSIKVREIFEYMATDNGETVPADFGPAWMGYRLLQGELLWALDHIARYGAGISEAPMPRLENTYCDIDYAVIATFADGLLSNDANVIRHFQLMAPTRYAGPDAPA